MYIKFIYAFIYVTKPLGVIYIHYNVLVCVYVYAISV